MYTTGCLTFGITATITVNPAATDYQLSIKPISIKKIYICTEKSTYNTL